jgi:hypothetical protein
MTGLDSRRIALIVARPTDRGAFIQSQEVATGYFLAGDLVFTVRHVADFPDCILDVCADVGRSETRSFQDRFCGRGDHVSLTPEWASRHGASATSLASWCGAVRGSPTDRSPL